MVQPEILLVEDNIEEVELALHAFGKHRSRVRVARDGVEALHALFGEPPIRPKLVVLDLKLPRMDGKQVLEKIKGDPGTRAIPVVILSASNQERDIEECYHLGCNSYVVKPVDFGQFGELAQLLATYWLSLNQAAQERTHRPEM